MAFRAASALVATSSVTLNALQVTMPAGTIASDHVLIVSGWGDGTLKSVTPSGPAGMSYGVVVDPVNAVNMGLVMWEATGLVAGDVVTITYSTTGSRAGQAFVFSNDIGAIGPVFLRSGGSTAVNAMLGRSIVSGQKMLVFSTERTTANPTAVNSAVMSTGETITQLSLAEAVGNSDCSFYLGEYTAASNNPGTATVTYNNASTNGAGVQIVEVSGQEAVPTGNANFGGQSGVFSAGISVPGAPGGFKAASPIVTSIDTISIPVPAGTLASDVVYVWTQWGNSSVKTITITGPAAKLGSVSTVVASRHDNVLGWNIQTMTGLVGGDVITMDITGGSPGNTTCKLFVFGQLLAPPGQIGARTTSTTFTVVPSVGTAPNSPVYLFAVERTLASGTLVTNAVNDSGFTVAQQAFQESSGDPNVTYYLGLVQPTTGASGDTTLTYTSAVNNGAGVGIPAVGVAATVAPVFGGQKGYFSISVKALTDGLLRTNLGRPGPDTVRVKTRTQGAGNVRLAVSASAAMTTPVYSSAVTPDADGYAALQVTGLQADTAYWYQIEFAGSLTGTVNAVRTWPTPGVPAATVAIMAAGCTLGFGTRNGPTNPTTFTNMRARTDAKGIPARLWVDLGDDFYPHTTTSPQGWPVPESAQVVRNYWEAQHTQSQRAAFHKVIPTSHTYSDGDFLGSNSDPTIAPATAVIVNAVRRQVLSDGPFGSTDGKGLYWSALLGRTLIIQTDSRTYMSDTMRPISDPTKTMLGATQKQWLLDQFARTDYTAVLWCHDNQWIGFPTVSTSRPALDNWQVFPLERQEIADFIVNNKVPLLAYVHADNHMLVYDDGTNNAYGGFPYTMTGPVNQSAQTWSNPVTGGFWPTASAGQNPANFYTWIEITDDGVNVSARFLGIDATSGTDQIKLDNTSTVVGERVPSSSLLHEFYANISLTDIVPQPSPDGGIVGPQGPQGVAGPPGPQGIPGVSGTKWWNGVGPPSPVPVGSHPGDYYLNTTNGDVYVL